MLGDQATRRAPEISNGPAIAAGNGRFIRHAMTTAIIVVAMPGMLLNPASSGAAVARRSSAARCAGVGCVGIDVAGLDVAGLDVAGLDVAGLDVAGLDAGALRATPVVEASNSGVGTLAEAGVGARSPKPDVTNGTYVLAIAT